MRLMRLCSCSASNHRQAHQDLRQACHGQFGQHVVLTSHVRDVLGEALNKVQRLRVLVVKTKRVAPAWGCHGAVRRRGRPQWKRAESARSRRFRGRPRRHDPEAKQFPAVVQTLPALISRPLSRPKCGHGERGGGGSCWLKKQRTSSSTQRRVVDEILRTTALLQAIGKISSDPIYAKDVDGQFVYANPAVLEVIGTSANWGHGYIDLEFHSDPEQAAIVIANDQRIMQTGITEVIEETWDVRG